MNDRQQLLAEVQSSTSEFLDHIQAWSDWIEYQLIAAGDDPKARCVYQAELAILHGVEELARNLTDQYFQTEEGSDEATPQ